MFETLGTVSHREWVLANLPLIPRGAGDRDASRIQAIWRSLCSGITVTNENHEIAFPLR